MSLQYCLISMSKKWKKSVEYSITFTTLLNGLLKASDSFPHGLIISKLNAYDFGLSCSRLIHTYISNWKQKTKICSLEEFEYSVPQGSIFKQLFLNFLYGIYCPRYAIQILLPTLIILAVAYFNRDGVK